ncbi:MAG: hypothetical protein RBU30_16060 [Polyangia bacterium]|nr:hypothetical protein [Polyangia bacterium]
MHRTVTIIISLLLGLGLAACPGKEIKQTDPEICANGMDDDGDGLIDCADPDCAQNPACLPETLCNDGLDNDGDGDMDCADSDCASQSYCETIEVTCDDEFDNDGDGLVDCADSDCVGTSDCTAIPETNCNDGLDNDSDGLADCADSDCATETYCEATEATCDDDFDNDGDGQVDCADSDCIATAVCTSNPETICNDGLDNDSDGDADCADSDCANESYCETVETSCNDGFDNDGDGDVDCADSSCASQTYCEAVEVTCDDQFDNDGDGLVDCIDSDCASAVACIPPAGVGSPCEDNTDCDDTGAVCLDEYDVGFPGGYCTVLSCNNDCPQGSSCISLGSDYTMCVADCTLGGTDCRDAYACEDAGGAGICWPACTLDTQCLVTEQCDTSSGFCVYGWVEAQGATVTGDGNSNGIADPGESFNLGFDAVNTGYGVAQGPISATLAVNTTTSTVTGTVNLTPPGSTQCSATDLASGASAACTPWGVVIPGTAQPEERLDFDVTFTNGTETWQDTLSLTIGSLWTSLLSALDPQGDNGTVTCDIKDVQGYVEGGVLYLRMVFYAACSISEYYDFWLTDGSGYITLSLENNAGTMTPAMWNYNGGNWQSLTPPPSYFVSPMGGTSDTLTYQIAVAAIPVINVSGGTVYLWASAYNANHNDDAPDTTATSISW